MKIVSKGYHPRMKHLLFGCMLAASLNSFGQRSLVAVIMDPSVGSIEMANNAGQQINAEFINPGQSVKLLVPVALNNHGKELPTGSCKIKIGLGSRLELDPAYDVNSTALSNYFSWTSARYNGQVQLTGELTAALPANITEADLVLHVKGNVLGSSTVTANFLVTNHNTTTILSDENGNNNGSFVSYTVTRELAPVPVCTITDISTNANCNVNLLFATSREVNVSRYEVEASKDGISFSKVGEVSAANLSSYTAGFPVTTALKSKSLYVRIKMLLGNGSAFYSAAKSADANCGNWKLNLFPNPATSNSKFVTINAVEGNFKGDYKVTMLDASGKVVLSKEVSLNYVSNFKLDFGFIASGKYLIKVLNADGSQSAVLTFEKM